MKALLPPNETQRLNALRQYEILDSDPEQDFDDITLLASHVCGTPIALISLVDENRQWFKSKIGVTESETPRDIAFCAHGILQPDFFEVADARADERFATNPLVTGESKIRFYAGSPLVTSDGQALGMLCVKDRVPRELSAAQITALQALSRQVVAQMELRKSLKKLQRNINQRQAVEIWLRDTEEKLLESKQFLQSTLDALSSNIAILDQDGTVMETNKAWRTFADENEMKSQSLGVNYLQVCDTASGQFAEEAPAMAAGIRAIIRGESDTFELEYPCHSPKEERWFIARVTRFNRNGRMRVVVAHGNISARKRAEAQVKESNETLEAIINSVEGIVLEANATTDQINFVSLKAEEILGYPVSRWLTESGFWREHLHPEDRARTVALSSEAMAQLRPLELVYRMIAADGHEVWFRDRTTFIGRPGEATVQRGLMIDITAHKQIEEMMQRQQAELRVLFDLMPAMIWFKDTTNGILRVNQRVAENAGKSVAEIEGRPSLEIYPEDAAKFYADDLEVIKSGAPKLGIVETLLGSKGEQLWVQTDKVPYRDKDGKVIGIVVVAHDITERRHDEEALRNSEERFQLVSRATDDAIWDWNIGANTISFSESLGRLFGYRVGEFESTMEFWMNGIHPEDHDGVLASVHAFFASRDEVWSGDDRFRCADGSYAFVYDRGYVVRDGDGKPLRMVGAMMNVTEQRRLEQELKDAKVAAAVREGAQRYSFLADAVPLMIWTARPDGGVDYFNKAWFDYTGLTSRQTKDWGWGAVVHPDDLEPIIERWTHSFTMGDDYEVEYRFKRASDGAYRWHLGRALPMRDDQGQIVQWVGTCTDIDDAKRSKETLQAANDELGLRVAARTVELSAAKEAAEAANMAKSEFLANMSHEIRTPMNGVIGMTGLLLDTDLNAEQRQFAETIHSSGESLLTVINDILDFSKSEAGKLVFEELDFDLHEAVHGSVEMLAQRAESKGLELAVFLEANVPVHLRGDPGRLRQVLINFVGNAIKFTERGEVVVKVSLESETAADALLRFEVKDTGIGISVDAQAGLFKPFSQADSSTTRKFGGTGLGLAISRQLIARMHGVPGIESVPGHGSVFWFTARLAKQPAGVHSQHAIPGELLNLRVLIVDDNETNCQILQRQTSAWKMRSGVARDAAGALAELRRALAAGEPYQVVLLDMQMPGTNGLILARRIKAESEMAGVRLVLLSSFGGRIPVEEMRAAGIADYLVKPVKQSLLFDSLATVMARPLARSTSTAEEVLPPLSLPAPATQKLRILLAEDNVVNQLVATSLLRKLGYRADTVADGTEVLDALRRIRYDVIFMDCQMPQLDGYETARRIRQLEQNSTAPFDWKMPIYIIAMTANAMEGDREKCLTAGMNDYLSKPVRKKELQEALDRRGEISLNEAGKQPAHSIA